MIKLCINQQKFHDTEDIPCWIILRAKKMLYNEPFLMEYINSNMCDWILTLGSGDARMFQILWGLMHYVVFQNQKCFDIKQVLL